MNLALTIFRWIVTVPAAMVGSDFVGMLLGFSSWGLRHLGGKIFGDPIDVLQKPLEVIDNFIIGVVFVLIGVLLVPIHHVAVPFGLVAAKAWVNHQRSPGSYQSAASTCGAISAAIALSHCPLLCPSNSEPLAIP